MLFFFTEKSNVTSFLRVVFKKHARKLVRKKVKNLLLTTVKTCPRRCSDDEISSGDHADSAGDSAGNPWKCDHQNDLFPFPGSGRDPF